MIVCSCTVLTDRDIHEAIAWMRASDPYTLITPGKIYRALGKGVECGGCMRLVVQQMRCTPTWRSMRSLARSVPRPESRDSKKFDPRAVLERFHIASLRARA